MLWHHWYVLFLSRCWRLLTIGIANLHATFVEVLTLLWNLKLPMCKYYTGGLRVSSASLKYIMNTFVNTIRWVRPFASKSWMSSVKLNCGFQYIQFLYVIQTNKMKTDKPRLYCILWIWKISRIQWIIAIACSVLESKLHNICVFHTYFLLLFFWLNYKLLFFILNFIFGKNLRLFYVNYNFYNFLMQYTLKITIICCFHQNSLKKSNFIETSFLFLLEIWNYDNLINKVQILLGSFNLT